MDIRGNCADCSLFIGRHTYDGIRYLRLLCRWLLIYFPRYSVIIADDYITRAYCWGSGAMPYLGWMQKTKQTTYFFCL